MSGDSVRSVDSPSGWLFKSELVGDGVRLLGCGEGLGVGSLVGTAGNAKKALGGSLESSFDGVGLCKNSAASYHWPNSSITNRRKTRTLMQGSPKTVQVIEG